MKTPSPKTVIVSVASAIAIGLVAYSFFGPSQSGTVKPGGLISDGRATLKSENSETNGIWHSNQPGQIGGTSVVTTAGAQTGEFGSVERSRLLDILKDRTAGIAERAAAAEQLGKLRERTALESFLTIVQDPTEPLTLRYKAVRGLGVLGDERAVPVLSSILSDEGAERNLRLVAALALGNLGTETSVQALKLASSDADSIIRFKAVQALGRTHQKSASEIVENAIQDPDPQIQARAIRSLAELGHTSAFQTISGILRTTQNDFIKIACLTGLGSMHTQESISLLHEYENDTNQLIRLNARAALQRLKEQERSQL
jgi:HEAT repeat protein